jgi:hypothetical protein
MNLADDLVRVQFLDVNFGSSEHRLTVWPADTLTLHDSGDIELISRTVSQETIVMRAEHIHWYRLADAEAPLPTPIDAERLERLGYPVTRQEPT